MIVGTAGHIDHGKTTLLKALTGVDADRLPEEKARGITIDLGFAYQHFTDAPSISYLDVPGHEKLVRNMLAGAIGIDFVLMTVAADDGVMPQTREHLAIIDLVGISRGVIALTKADRVSSDRLIHVAADIEELVRGTSLQGARIVPCSAFDGRGISDLTSILHAANAEKAHRAPSGNFRLAVDRAFTLTGIGLVVTGTVYAGEVHPGDELIHSRSGNEVRVRGLRSENRPAEQAVAGQRCALNLSARRLQKDDIRRGDWILVPAINAPTERFDVRLRLLPSEKRSLKHWTPVHIHSGSASITGRVSLLEGKSLDPGTEAFAQLVADEPLGVLTGDRVVIRDQSAVRTVGGGVVLDPRPPSRGARTAQRLTHLQGLSSGSPVAALDSLIAGSPQPLDLAHFTLSWNLTAGEAVRLFAERDVVVIKQDGAVIGISKEQWSALSAEILGWLHDFHAQHADSPGATIDEAVNAVREPKARLLRRRALRGLLDEGAIARFGQVIHLPGRMVSLPVEENVLWGEIKDRLMSAALDPPRATRLAEALGMPAADLLPFLEKLSRIGWLTRVSKAYFMLPEVVASLAAEAEQAASAHEKSLLTVGDFRDATGANRHMATPLLEFFDKAGLTRRLKSGRQMRTSWIDLQRTRAAL